MKKQIYKISCEYYIYADNELKANDFVIDELANGNFFESHIIITWVNKEDVNEDDIYNREEKN